MVILRTDYWKIIGAIKDGAMALVQKPLLALVACCNEEAVSLDPNAALLINKRRSNRQGSETVQV